MFKLYAITINPKTRIVQRELVLHVEYDFNQALDAVDLLNKHRDQTAKFGTFRNPLRYEAASPTGIAERF